MNGLIITCAAEGCEREINRGAVARWITAHPSGAENYTLTPCDGTWQARRVGDHRSPSVRSDAMASAQANASTKTSGYSGTPLVRKLGIKPDARLAVLGAPSGFETTLGELPTGVSIRRRARGPLDVILAFFVHRSDLERRLPGLASALQPAGGLWIAWPKRASGVATDVTENVVRELGLAAGLVDNKVCAVDEVWSGLRLVYRLRDRPRAS
jgi:hypothetical protein